MSQLPTAHFTIGSQADPGLLPRLLALFAKRGLIPDHFESRRDLRLDSLAICLAMNGLDSIVADHIEKVIGQIPGIFLVSLEWR